MLRIYKTRWMTRFLRRENVDDASLVEAVQRAERGLIDADLGGGLIKQRVARLGEGKRGGYRMLVVYRIRDLAIFIYGFAKNERTNIGSDELQSAREIAGYWLKATAAMFRKAIDEKELTEVRDGQDED